MTFGWPAFKKAKFVVGTKNCSGVHTNSHSGRFASSNVVTLRSVWPTRPLQMAFGGFHSSGKIAVCALLNKQRFVCAMLRTGDDKLTGEAVNEARPAGRASRRQH